ncbi:MAG: rRNA maturation RNase YbeY, partial [Burkholderiaceae bacterium]
MKELSLAIQGASKFDQLPARSTVLRWVQAALEAPAQLTLRYVDADEGCSLNRQFRGKDYATNVLTFDYAHEPLVMADLVICVPVLVREAAEQGKTFRDHLAHLVVHGVLHA